MLVILNVSCDIAGLVGDTMLVSRSSAGCLVCIFENHCNLDGLVGDTTLEEEEEEENDDDDDDPGTPITNE